MLTKLFIELFTEDACPRPSFRGIHGLVSVFQYVKPDTTTGDGSTLAMWDGQWPTNRGLLTLVAEADRLTGEFESGADGALAGAQVALVPEQENRYFAIGRWSATAGPFECAEAFEVEPGYWGEIWLSLGTNDSLFGGFNHCGKRGGGAIIVD